MMERVVARPIGVRDWQRDAQACLFDESGRMRRLRIARIAR